MATQPESQYLFGKKGTAISIPVFLQPDINSNDYLTNPTIVAGDVMISKDFGTFGNVATLPVVTPAGSGQVLLSLSDAEMDADVLTVRFQDVSGTEWGSLVLVIEMLVNKVALDAQGRVNVGLILDVAPTLSAAGNLDVNIAEISESEPAADALESIMLGNTFQTVNVTQLDGSVPAATALREFSLENDTWNVNTVTYDSALNFNPVQQTSILTQALNALNTATPGSPVLNSINERIVAIDVLTEAGGAGDLAAMSAAVLTDGVQLDMDQLKPAFGSVVHNSVGDGLQSVQAMIYGGNSTAANALSQTDQDSNTLSVRNFTPDSVNPVGLQPAP